MCLRFISSQSDVGLRPTARHRSILANLSMALFGGQGTRRLLVPTVGWVCRRHSASSHDGKRQPEPHGEQGPRPWGYAYRPAGRREFHKAAASRHIIILGLFERVGRRQLAGRPSPAASAVSVPDPDAPLTERDAWMKRVLRDDQTGEQSHRRRRPRRRLSQRAVHRQFADVLGACAPAGEYVFRRTGPTSQLSSLLTPAGDFLDADRDDHSAATHECA